jgi:hypothetical protein
MAVGRELGERPRDRGEQYLFGSARADQASDGGGVSSMVIVFLTISSSGSFPTPRLAR